MKRGIESLLLIMNSYKTNENKQTRKMINGYGRRKFIKDVIKHKHIFESHGDWRVTGQELKDCLILLAIEN